jgi:hypothetical protein
MASRHELPASGCQLPATSYQLPAGDVTLHRIHRPQADLRIEEHDERSVSRCDRHGSCEGRGYGDHPGFREGQEFFSADGDDDAVGLEYRFDPDQSNAGTGNRRSRERNRKGPPAIGNHGYPRYRRRDDRFPGRDVSGRDGVAQIGHFHRSIRDAAPHDLGVGDGCARCDRARRKRIQDLGTASQVPQERGDDDRYGDRPPDVRRSGQPEHPSTVSSGGCRGKGVEDEAPSPWSPRASRGNGGGPAFGYPRRGKPQPPLLRIDGLRGRTFASKGA